MEILICDKCGKEFNWLIQQPNLDRYCEKCDKEAKKK